MKSIFLFFLLVCLLLFSCKKNNANNKYLLSCSDPEKLDSIQTGLRLAGTWKLIKTKCNVEDDVADKNIQIAFMGNRTYAITENSTIVGNGSWKLSQYSTNWWQPKLSGSEYRLGGSLFCSNQALFMDSPFDGCDYLFEKVK